jgi:ribonuclease P protein component
VYKRGRKARRPSFTVFGLPNDVGRCRIGLTVTRKVGGAVARNRIKRVLREVFRRHGMKLEQPMDLVVNGQRALLRMSARQIEQELLGAIAKLGSNVGR